jgi:hypothetical protein
MARRTTQPPPPRRSAFLTADEIRAGIDRLQRRLDDVRKFEPTSVTEQMSIPHVEALSASIEEALVRAFGPDTLDYERYKSAKDFDNDPFNYAYEVPIQAVQQSLARSKASSSALLERAIRSRNEQAHELASAPSPTANLPLKAPKAPSKDVFIVHGHDEGARETVPDFCKRSALIRSSSTRKPAKVAP